MVDVVWTREQQAAIDHEHGPLRIIAGAGSGKTATMTAHIARLIQSGTARPEQIVALTFTNAAAAELSERIQRVLGDNRVEVWSGTYHSFGGQIVADGAATLDLPVEPKLLSEVEVWLTIRKILQAGLEIEQLNMVNFAQAINGLVNFISRSKDELVSPAAIRDYIEQLPEDDHIHAAEMRDYLRLYEAYLAHCHARGAIDFGDQIQLAVQALDGDPELLAEYRDRYRFFVVDEYQDTNFAQAELVRRLAAPEHHLRVVGDPQQSIYRFRGAAVDNIKRFSNEIEGVTDIALSTNFRSHQQILDIANRVVEDAEMASTLTAHKGKSGQKPVVANAAAWSDETQWIAEVLESHRERGTTSMAALVRKRKLLPGIARALERRGIPVQILGGEGIFDLPAVKDAVATIRVLCKPTDTTSAVRVLTSPRCGLNDHTVYALRDHLRSSNYIRSLQEIVAHPPPDLDPAVVTAVQAFCDDLSSLVRTSKSQGADVLTRRVIARQQPDHPVTELRALDQLVSIAVQFTQNGVDTTLAAFVDYLDALAQMSSGEGRIEAVPEDGSVALMTIHGAKGLEFDVVVIAGMNRWDAGSTSDPVSRMYPAGLRHDRGLFPHRDEFLDRDAYLEGIKEVEKRLSDDEERRLFYVAFTRARDALYLSWSETHPSRARKTTAFKLLKELEDLVQKVEIPSYPAVLDDPPLQTFFSATPTRLDPAEGFETFVRDWSTYWRGKPAEAEAMAALDDGLARYGAGKEAQLALVEQVRRTLLDTTFAPVSRPVYSFSQISTYEDCPRRYLLQYLVGVPANPADDWQTQLGSAFHGALHAQHIAREHGQEVDFREVVRRAFDETGGEYESSATQTAIDGFLASPDAASIPLATEQEFYLRLGSGREAPVLHGFIDRIQKTPAGDIEIVDYKTNRQNKTRDQVLTDLQLPIYVLACREAIGWEPRYATMAFVRHNNWVRLPVEDLDLASARLRIDSAIHGITTGNFECTCGGSRCSV